MIKIEDDKTKGCLMQSGSISPGTTFRGKIYDFEYHSNTIFMMVDLRLGDHIIVDLSTGLGYPTKFDGEFFMIEDYEPVDCILKTK